MFLFRYKILSSPNSIYPIERFKNDLNICLNLFENMNEICDVYVDKFIKYFESLCKIVGGFLNELIDVEYVVEFKMIVKNNVPCLYLNRMFVNNFNNTNISSHVKHLDYINIVNFLDYNYEILVNIDPYYVVSVKKTVEYNQQTEFYRGRYILLRKVGFDEFIEINLDKGVIHYFDLVQGVLNIDELDCMDSFTFKIFNGKICVFDGPNYEIKMGVGNEIWLNDILYEIDTNSTVGFESLGFGKLLC